MDDFYRELILDHYQHPRNTGTLDPHDISYEDDNPLCGDRIRIDLRVDDDPDPVGRLAELLALHTLYFGASDPGALLPIDAALAAELQTLLIRQGYLDGPVSGAWDAASVDAFWRFVGTENLEERWSPDAPDVLDPVVLDFIRERFPG